MDPENIDWGSIESVFVEDETYENFEAPKWVDLSSPDELIGDEAWFCSPDCNHPKAAEDFLKSAPNLKVKLLRSLSISEILPFRERNRRDVKVKGVEIKPPLAAAEFPKTKTENSNSLCNVYEESENKNPNFPPPVPLSKTKPTKAPMNPSNVKKKAVDESSHGSSNFGRKPQLKSTFSASNLLGRASNVESNHGILCGIEEIGKTGFEKRWIIRES
ncbi:uncharacterized protein Pyn_37798 [Prunus yedoensis var. nudiflora]|uniref:Uncharacterized protein n=1 Tax=Prunus yedoensis var. nudiflora TaxID=2094558 RepID=A0A314Y142_PRUYE|nr:uncharacterized protein Pyn_37798 [Prunus yedoensis var. nudiflora]